MDVFEMFVSFIFAMIVKDFYDIFIKTHIVSILSRYKVTMTLKKIKLGGNKNGE